MKVKKGTLSDSERIATLDALYTAAGTVKGRGAMKAFLRDLLTESERIMLGRRIIIARRLLKDDSPEVIADEMRVGYDTIYRISRWLDEQFSGYREALKGMEREFKKREVRAEIKNGPFSFKALKRKYPLHFLLFLDRDSTPKKKYDIS